MLAKPKNEYEPVFSLLIEKTSGCRIEQEKENTKKLKKWYKKYKFLGYFNSQLTPYKMVPIATSLDKIYDEKYTFKI